LLADLDALQAYGEENLKELSSRDLITFHDGFGYFAASFGLHILEAVEEESGSEASAQELKHLIGMVRDHDLKAIFIETNGSISVCKRPGAQTATLDDLKLEKPADRLPHLPVLVQGETDTALLQSLGMEADLPDRLLKKENCPRQQALVLLCNAAGDYRLIRREGAKAGTVKTKQEG
jgi:hypothetical protein